MGDIKVDIKIVGPQETEVQPQNPESTPVITGDLLLHSVGQMFNLRPGEIDNDREKILLLIDFAETLTEDRSPEGVKWAIRSLQGRVGTPPLGEKWLPFLSKYAYIKLESMKMQKEVEKYERYNH
jgi:hypothetical protein